MYATWIHLLLCVFCTNFSEISVKSVGSVNGADEGQSAKRLARLISSQRYCNANETRVETC